MAFNTLAALLSGKRPFFLYEFSRGSARWFFTSVNKVWTTVPDMFGLADVFAEPNCFSRAWVPSAIRHGKVPHTSKSARSEFLVTFPQSDSFVRSFLSPIGLDSTKLVIWKGFENDPDLELAVVYRGRVIQANPSDKAGTISLVCGTGLSDLDRKALPAVMQRPCRHVVYYGACRLKIEDWQVTLSATGVAGLTLTVPDAALEVDGFYNAGIIEYLGAREMINTHVGDALVLASEVIGLADEIGSSGLAEIKLARGCDRAFATCRDAFANEDNHGGFPHMTDSPFAGRSIS